MLDWVGDPAPPPQRGTAPHFSAHICCGPMAAACMDQDVTWYGARPRPRQLCVRWRSRCPFPKGGGGPPKFSAHVYCDQTAGWMPLGTEVNLDPGDVVLDGVADPLKRAQPPVFGSCLLWPNGCMDEDTTWYGSRPRPRPHFVRLVPAPLERGTAAPLFSAHVYCSHGRPSQLLLSSCC